MLTGEHRIPYVGGKSQRGQSQQYNWQGDAGSDDNTLMVSHGDVTATSAAATSVTGAGCSTGSQVTASEVNTQSFTFANGGVFQQCAKLHADLGWCGQWDSDGYKQCGGEIL